MFSNAGRSQCRAIIVWIAVLQPQMCVFTSLWGWPRRVCGLIIMSKRCARSDGLRWCLLFSKIFWWGLRKSAQSGSVSIWYVSGYAYMVLDCQEGPLQSYSYMLTEHYIAQFKPYLLLKLLKSSLFSSSAHNSSCIEGVVEASLIFNCCCQQYLIITNSI